jgi:L-ascorbate metabolism protein UlaG (beta-lactamase superfamily)
MIAKRITIIAGSLVLIAFLYMQLPKFGSIPADERLEKSPNYKDGKFRNTLATPVIAEGHSIGEVLWKQVFNKYPRRFPAHALPAVKTDLLHLTPDANILVWFGHSSCFMQLNGKTFLIDPVFSNNVSPIPATVTPYPGTDIYTAADLPVIDYLLISHDHYDHLDYETVVALKDQTKKVICGLGVGADFERWGYSLDKIIEKDWHEKVTLDSGIIIYTEPSRHQSGRTFKQDKTLWMSYLIQTPDLKIYFSGDGGYDERFAAIGREFGPIDLAVLECGQYDSAWHYVHLLPEEVLKAATDLKAKRLLPDHNSKFTLARHPWDEPLSKLTLLNSRYHISLVTPMIGEVVNLNDSTQQFKQWWKT